MDMTSGEGVPKSQLPSPGDSVVPSEATPQSFVEGLHTARAQGLSLHDMGPEVTVPLAQDHGIYTHEQPQRPGNFREFLQNQKRQDSLRTIGRRAAEAFKYTPGFEEAASNGKLGEKLVETLSPVTHLHAENVHVERIEPQTPRWMKLLGIGRLFQAKPQELVIADSMELTVSTEDEASLVINALQTMLRKSDPDPKYTNNFDKKHRDGAYAVTTSRFSEHDARSVSRILGAVLHYEAPDKNSMALGRTVAGVSESNKLTRPTTKLSLERLEHNGQTIPPATRRVLLEEDAAYQRLRAETTITGSIAGDGAPAQSLELTERPGYHLIVTDPTPVLQAERDAMNTVIWQLPRGRNANPEQNPDKGARPILEAGIELRRDPRPKDEAHLGPPTSRPPKWSELVKDTSAEAFREDPLSPLAVLGSIPLALTWSAFVPLVPAARYLPKITKSMGRLHANYQEWREQKQAAAAVDKKLDDLAYTLVFRNKAAKKPQS